MRPAWSEPFAHDAVPPAPTLPLALTSEWAFGDATGAGVRVAIVDSGVEAGHPAVGDVAGAVAFAADPETADGVRAVEGPHDDLFGHGTACAAIVRCIAPDVELWSLRVLGERLTTRARVFTTALEWALDHRMNVINLSLSTTNDEWYGTLHELCDRAAFAGVMVVSALANERKASYPSEFSSVFSVAASEDLDPQHWWCNPGPPAEWGAPGIDLDVAWLGGTTITATGNSFAAPHISGHLARLLQAHPGITTWQAKAVLAQLAANAR